MMKKCLYRFGYLMISTALVLGMAACGQAKTDTASQGGNTAAVASTEQTKAEEPKQLTLKVWDINPAETDPKFKPRNAAIDNLAKKYPNIKIDLLAEPNENYKTKIKVAASANELPDIFFSWGAGFAKPLVGTGNLMVIDDYIKDIKNQLAEGAAQYFTYDGKVYGLPFNMWAGTLFCNKELFDKYQVKIPETWEELLTAIKVFKQNGITPMSCGEKDLWPGMLHQNILAIRTAGLDASIKALNKEASYDTPEMAESAAKLVELADAGAFNPGYFGMANADAKNEFNQGKSAMVYMLSVWAGAFDADDSPVKGKVVVKNFPALDGAKGDNNGFLGGSVDGYFINSKVEDKDMVMKYYIDFVKTLSKYSSELNGDLSPWKLEDLDTSKFGPVAKDIRQMITNSKGYVLSWDTILEGKDADTHKNLIANLLAKEITPAEFAKEMQKLNAAAN